MVFHSGNPVCSLPSGWSTRGDKKACPEVALIGPRTDHSPSSANTNRMMRWDIYLGYDFVHLSSEYYIYMPTNLTVSMRDINTYQGLVNFKGNSGQFAVSTDTHR
jgi:hypothetical protein